MKSSELSGRLDTGAVEQPGASEPLGMKCVYCGKPDASWLPADLQCGRRWKDGGGGTLEYHCYEGYAWD